MERRPVRQGIFLIHGEPGARNALKQQIAGKIMPEEQILTPAIDDIYVLSADGAVQSDGRKRRIAPEATARLDWNNALTELILDINEIVEKAPGEKARDVIIRRIRRALEDGKADRK